VQAYVTADLRHHPADEHRRASDVGLVDVAHWASDTLGVPRRRV
jgi:putative NIF3 family GTP cyclohydrolase 1 type 2